MDHAGIATTVRLLLRSLEQQRFDVDALSDDDNLYEVGLKSLDAVHLILAVEQEYAIEFSDDMFQRQMFSTISRIAHSVLAARR
jgi:acyl carrier protein